MTIDILHRPTGNDEHVRRLGPYGIETLIRPEEQAALTAYRVRIEPHQTTTISYHKVAEELYFVLAGAGIAVLNGRPHALKAGDFLRLPPGTTHGFITADQALDMLDIHAPGCRPDHDVYFVDSKPAGFA